MYRGLPLQQQKILDTDLSAQECQENVKIYQVIGISSFEVSPYVSYDVFVAFYYAFTF